ncbi:prephenate dehydrogenase/arogenate dehydrogenase family protein [Streptomyces sp. NPDC058534]|uniref:prephenate dehydrogenase/arogenate dehydrogenase family protein n=1 Tax=Streptomyces sp. NPDC058534 TaxID=3346541 RepID=UPI00364C8276
MRSVVIVGAGVIGRSVGLALRRHGVTTYLDDADPEAALAGERCGAGFAARPPRQADIAVLAVPPDQVAPVLAEHQKLGTARCYTDVSGVKVRLHREVRAYGCDLTSLVSGAPVVGGGVSPAQPRADLFDGRPWALTPTEATGNLALNCALELVALCGAVSVLLDPEAHDRAVALVSHAPHLVASLGGAPGGGAGGVGPAGGAGAPPAPAHQRAARAPRLPRPPPPRGGPPARPPGGGGPPPRPYGWPARTCATSPGPRTATPRCGRRP